MSVKFVSVGWSLLSHYANKSTALYAYYITHTYTPTVAEKSVSEDVDDEGEQVYDEGGPLYARTDNVPLIVHNRRRPLWQYHKRLF